MDQAVTPELLREALTGTDADVARTAASIAFNLHKVGEDVVASGRLNATLGLSCVACLQPTRLDANVGVRAVFRPDVDPDSEEDLFPHDRKEVDLWPMVRISGADLNGSAMVPGLAGRSPSYLARQLNDFRQGTRKGVLSR